MLCSGFMFGLAVATAIAAAPYQTEPDLRPRVVQQTQFYSLQIATEPNGAKVRNGHAVKHGVNWYIEARPEHEGPGTPYFQTNKSTDLVETSQLRSSANKDTFAIAFRLKGALTGGLMIPSTDNPGPDPVYLKHNGSGSTGWTTDNQFILGAEYQYLDFSDHGRTAYFFLCKVKLGKKHAWILESSSTDENKSVHKCKKATLQQTPYYPDSKRI